MGNRPIRLIVLLLLCVAGQGASGEGEQPTFLGQVAYPHSRVIHNSGTIVGEYLLGLGALQKVGGRWRHKRSEILQGSLQRTTWQVNEPYTADEAFTWIQEHLPEDVEVLFECQGRDCGSSAQWADRVFQQRLLYGHDDRQRYGAYRLVGGETWVVVYAADRANRRHYVHVDVLQRSPPEPVTGSAN
jgi:hypothetical protein